MIAQLFDTALRHFDVIAPNIISFRIIPVNAEPQSFAWYFKTLREQVKSPFNSFLFEIVSKGKIAQHFKKGMVIRRASNIVQIARPQAFLRTGGPFHIFFDAQEIILELVHTGSREKEGRVPLRDQRITANDFMSSFGKKIEIFVPDPINRPLCLICHIFYLMACATSRHTPE